MARIALIKIFPGLNLPVAQLSAELIQAGHACEVFFFKESFHAREHELDRFELPDVPAKYITAESSGLVSLYSHCYRPFNPAELNHLISALTQFNPDAIGFSVLSTDMAANAQITALLRQHLSVPMVWGGYGPTFEPERAIQSADVICVGEGEGVIRDIAERLDVGKPLIGIPGTWYRDKQGDVHKTPRRDLSDLESLAHPNWDTDTYHYLKGVKTVSPVDPSLSAMVGYTTMTQRGCPFSCSFCGETRYQGLYGKKAVLRRRSPENVIRELVAARESTDHRYVLFVDPIFTINPRWLQAFLPRYKKEIGLPFWCWTYPNTHNPEILKLLHDNGCINITMGVQSGSARILRDVFNRPTDIQRVIDAGQEIVDSGIEGYFDLIPVTGFETEADLRDTFEFMLEFPLGMNLLQFNEMIYFPSYGITERYHRESRVLASTGPSEDDYLYYLKLYALTREPLPRNEIRRIGEDPYFRQDHRRLDAFLQGEKFLEKLSQMHPYG